MSQGNQLRTWLTVARHRRYEASSREHEESFAKVMARLEASRRRPWRRLLVAGSLVAALVVSSLFAGKESSLSFRTHSWHGSSAVRAIQFSDGTHIELARDSSFDVTSVDDRGAALRLVGGHASLAVTPRKGARWIVQAGPYRVLVTGTAFDLDWSEATQRFEIAMQHGSVVVTGPQIARGEVPLRAGERLVVFARQAPHEDAVPSASEPEANQARAEVSEPAARPVPPATVTHARQAARTFSHGWQDRVASNELDIVLAEVERFGVGTTLEHAQLDDLAALADAARYARRGQLARQVLLAMRRRFRDAPATRDSAFMLARLTEGERALRWYQRYLEEQPNGTYASEALGRMMTLAHEAADHTRAVDSAARYLEREPRGPYAQSARIIARRAAEPPASTSRSRAEPPASTSTP